MRCAAQSVFAFGLAMLLVGCGFQLRASTEFPAQMTRIYIDAVDRYTPFYRELTNAIRASDAEVAADRRSADSILRVRRDETGRRALSVSVRNVPREYEIFYIVEFSVDIDAVQVLEPQRLTLTRDYTYDETLVLGKDREEQTLRNAIAADMVGLVRQRLSALQ